MAGGSAVKDDPATDDAQMRLILLEAVVQQAYVAVSDSTLQNAHVSMGSYAWALSSSCLTLLQGVRLSARGAHDVVDPEMARLGLVARLSNEVWASCRRSGAGGGNLEGALKGDGGVCDELRAIDDATRAAAAILPSVVVFESACGAHMLRRLQRAFSLSSPFWPEHRYFDEETPYFSYLYSLVSLGRDLDNSLSSGFF